MSAQSLSIPTPIFNHPTYPPKCTKTIPIYNSLSGFCSSSKRVSKIYANSLTISRFNLGFCNVAKRVSGASLCFKNDDSLSEKCDENDDAYYMRRCVELAKQAIGCTSPNPMVGCVIVKDGKIVGEGFHPKAGQPHAEVFALRNAGAQAENATAYVSLEPCNHYGRTPPCSEALVKAKVKKVVVGMVDPNPVVHSRGINTLEEAGIEVTVGVEEDLCKKLNEAFIHKMLTGKPFVSVRYSLSVNGVLSGLVGEDGNDCGGYYSKLLQEYDAVMHACTESTQAFSPSLSKEPNARQPLNILVVKNHTSAIQINYPTEEDCKVIVFAENEIVLEPKMSEMGIETVVMDRISLDAILEYCNTQGFCNVLMDLTGNLNGWEEFLEEGLEKNLLQKTIVEVLPHWDNKGTPSTSAIKNVTQSKRLKDLSSGTSGKSVLLEGYF